MPGLSWWRSAEYQLADNSFLDLSSQNRFQKHFAVSVNSFKFLVLNPEIRRYLLEISWSVWDSVASRSLQQQQQHHDHEFRLQTSAELHLVFMLTHKRNCRTQVQKHTRGHLERIFLLHNQAFGAHWDLIMVIVPGTLLSLKSYSV